MKAAVDWFFFVAWLIGRGLYYTVAICLAPLWLLVVAFIFACTDHSLEDVAPWRRRS